MHPRMAIPGWTGCRRRRPHSQTLITARVCSHPHGTLPVRYAYSVCLQRGVCNQHCPCDSTLPYLPLPAAARPQLPHLCKHTHPSLSDTPYTHFEFLKPPEILYRKKIPNPITNQSPAPPPLSSCVSSAIGAPSPRLAAGSSVAGAPPPSAPYMRTCEARRVGTICSLQGWGLCTRTPSCKICVACTVYILQGAVSVLYTTCIVIAKVVG